MGVALILVNGHSASGKTMLANWFGARLGFPVVSKDFFKERLYDQRPPADRAESQEHGRRAYDEMYAEAERRLRSGASVVLDAPMHRDHSQPVIDALVAATGAAVVQVVLQADRAVLETRYLERACRVSATRRTRWRTRRSGWRRRSSSRSARCRSSERSR